MLNHQSNTETQEGGCLLEQSYTLQGMAIPQQRLDVIRQYRDNHLNDQAAGSELINFYYEVSKQFADNQDMSESEHKKIAYYFTAEFTPKILKMIESANPNKEAIITETRQALDWALENTKQQIAH